LPPSCAPFEVHETQCPLSDFGTFSLESLRNSAGSARHRSLPPWGSRSRELYRINRSVSNKFAAISRSSRTPTRHPCLDKSSLLECSLRRSRRSGEGLCQDATPRPSGCILRRPVLSEGL